jgi:hypothetical protein
MPHNTRTWIGTGVLAMLVAGCSSPTPPGAPGKHGWNAVTIRVEGMEERLSLR